MDYIAAIKKFIDPIIVHKDQIVIEELANESTKDRTFQIICENEDAGRLIGKHGSTAEALREVISIAGKTNGERIHLKFVSKEENREAKAEE